MLKYLVLALLGQALPLLADPSICTITKTRSLIVTTTDLTQSASTFCLNCEHIAYTAAPEVLCTAKLPVVTTTLTGTSASTIVIGTIPAPDETSSIITVGGASSGHASATSRTTTTTYRPQSTIIQIVPTITNSSASAYPTPGNSTSAILPSSTLAVYTGRGSRIGASLMAMLAASMSTLFLYRIL